MKGNHKLLNTHTNIICMTLCKAPRSSCWCNIADKYLIFSIQLLFVFECCVRYVRYIAYMELLGPCWSHFVFAFCWWLGIGKTIFHLIKSKFKYCSSIIASRVYIYNFTAIRISTWELDYKVYTEVMKWNDRNIHIFTQVHIACMRYGDKTLNKVNSVYSWKIKLIFMNFIFFFLYYVLVLLFDSVITLRFVVGKKAN